MDSETKARKHKSHKMNPISLANLKIGNRGSYPTPKSLANLRPQRHDEPSRNPAGRPTKDLSLTSLLKVEIQKIPKGEKEGRTWREILVQAWIVGALKNPLLFRELLERLDGKVKQPVSLSLDFRAEAERVASELGLPVEDVEAEARKIWPLLRPGHDGS